MTTRSMGPSPDPRAARESIDDPVPSTHSRGLRWRPGPSALAFTATLVLLGAFTRIAFLEPWGASEEMLAEIRALAPALMATVAVAHAAVAAAAARLRRVPTALALLILTTSVLPLLADGLRGPIHAVLVQAAPRFCGDWVGQESCPPDAWSPLVGGLVGVLLSPIVATAVRLRDQIAADSGARMLWITGLWTGVVTWALRAAHLAGPAPLALASTVALICALVGFSDTVLRAVRLRGLLRAGRFMVRAPRGDEGNGLRPYASLPRAVPSDAILWLDEVREASPYRTQRHGRPVALSPMDVSLLVHALLARLRRQALLLVALIAALGWVLA